MINGLISNELQRTYKKHPDFSSEHEAYAVLLEEVEEAQEALTDITEDMDELWYYTKNDLRHNYFDTIKDIRRKAYHGIEELIQVCAMCDKALKLKEGKK